MPQPGRNDIDDAAPARAAVLVILAFVLIASILGIVGGHINLNGVGMQLPAPNAPITVP
jgi:predicted DNA repair protein MutK